MVLAFFSPDNSFDELFLSNYATQNVLDPLKRVPGTTNVQIFGAKDYAMRIWMRPDRMAQLGVTASDIAAAVPNRMRSSPPARSARPPANRGTDYTVTAKGRLLAPEEFANIIVRTEPGGATVRIRDVARVELGSKDYNLKGRVNGQSANIGMFLQPGANALDTRESGRPRWPS